MAAGAADPRTPAAAAGSTALVDAVDAVDALLPQTQCTKCGFDGCRPYAQALVAGTAAINRCPPGGAAGIARLAERLGRPVLALDPTRGEEAPRRTAWIDPALCIGCTRCIQACPVDAIIGAQRRMHTVAVAQCTGCELCVAPCPVDCIAMRPLPAGEDGWSDEDARAARERHRARADRLARLGEERRARLAARAPVAGDDARTERRRAIIEAAMRRARDRLAGSPAAPGRREAR
jgi:electron transport complex protein RnfB